MTTTGAISATFCATLVDEWVRAGVRYAMVAPGSRSTPLAVALLRNADISVEVFHDERVAAFAALGVGLSTGVPAVVVCSSGTAGAHFYAAVIEADLSNVPIIVCTADRPPHLRDIAAPQTVDQTKMYGSRVRWFHDPGVPTAIPQSTWRALASRAFNSSVGSRPGPVHLNLPFDEPLYGEPGELPAPRPMRWSSRHIAKTFAQTDCENFAQLVSQRKGIFIAGKNADEALLHLAAHLQWPVFADPRSGVRVGHENVVIGFDALLRVEEIRNKWIPDIVVCVGEPPASKVLSQWITQLDCDVVQIQSADNVIDPLHRVSFAFVGALNSLSSYIIETLPISTDDAWRSQWKRADRMAQSVIDRWTGQTWSEISVSRYLSSSLQDGSQLMLSSSMPIRDFEWFGRELGNVEVFSNRGANGIDGVISTAIGAAVATGKTTYVLIGDVALIHDSNSLIGLCARNVDVRLVVVNNDGGSIFSFLPQAQFVVGTEFETLYGTPHGVSFEHLARAHGIAYHCVRSADDLTSALNSTGPILIEAAFVRDVNVSQHEDLHSHVIREIKELMA